MPNLTATDGLGVVILAYGGGGEHGRLLDSLRMEGVPEKALIVVHNPAAPGEAAPPMPAGIELVRAGGNLGYAGGMNLGLRRAVERGFDLLLVLTHDARLRPGCLAALLAARERLPEFGVLGPALVFTGSDRPFSYGGATDANGFSSHIRETPTEAVKGVAPCAWVDGGAMLLRRDVLERVGDFDERFWGYCEDSDLCLRVRRAGFRVGVVLDACAEQAPGSSKRPGAWAYLMTRNGIAYARRAAGPRGLVACIGRALWLSTFSALRTGLRGAGLRPGPAAETWALTVGTTRGVIDFARGRWGPPPPGLPGMGDLENV